jgi:WD40 repeat protein/energy-coupling factor transporter ATP-binding protein EcfA2
MHSSDQRLEPRTAFIGQFALLYAAAGDPSLKRVADAVTRAGKRDERGRVIRVSPQRISDWRRGRNVPAKFAVLVPVLEVLILQARKAQPTPEVRGLYDLRTWQRLWERALTSPAAADDTTEPLVEEDKHDADESSICPYKGLSAFTQDDAAWFFGRERSMVVLLGQLSLVLEHPGIVVVVGASGAGKSSLLRAGLVPALTGGRLPSAGSEKWPVVTMTPTSDPLRELARHVPELSPLLAKSLASFDDGETAGSTSSDGSETGMAEFEASLRVAAAAHAGDGGRLVLVVDQFEEAFTLVQDERAVRHFVQVLQAISAPDSGGGVPPTIVILGMRADFYAHCLDYPELAESLQRRQMVLGAMSTDELKGVILKPAHAAGLEFEPGLVEVMLRDLRAGDGLAGSATTSGVYDAGSLPLLSHALLATWRKRSGNKMTVADYHAAGGIRGAVAASAERAWAQLSPAAQESARGLLVRMVWVGTETGDTRRRMAKQEIENLRRQSPPVGEALDVLVAERLVTVDAESVDITHETLISAWPRLRRWIDQDRTGNVLRQRLEDDSRTWAEQARDSSLLYRGSRLDAARQWMRTLDGVVPGKLTTEFVAASHKHVRRASMIRRAAIALITVLALVATLVAVVAIGQRDDAQYSQLVTEADRIQQSDPSLSAQLNMAARNLRPTDKNVASRLISAQNTPLAAALAGHGGAVYTVTFSSDGRVLATGGFDKTVRLWDVHDSAHPVALGQPLTGFGAAVRSLSFSPDGRTLAAASEDKTVRLWDVADRTHPIQIGEALAAHTAAIWSLAFSSDGRVLATGGFDKTVRLWDVHDSAHPVALGQPLTGFGAAVRSLSFSPDGGTLATAGDDGDVRLWNVHDTSNVVIGGQPFAGTTGPIWSLAFSPDGRVLATGGFDKTVRLWDVHDSAHPVALGQPLTAHTGAVASMAFSSDGTMLATASYDQSIRLWNVRDPGQPTSAGQPLTGSTGVVFAIAFSPNGTTIAAGSLDGLGRLWSLPPTVLYGHKASVLSVVFSPDGHLLATASEDMTVRLWDVRDPARPLAIGHPITGHTATVWSLSFSPDGRLLATASDDMTVRLWDVRDPARPLAVGPPIIGHTSTIQYVTFSPDGRTLATGSFDKTVRLWDVADPARPVPLGQPLTGHSDTVWSVAFSPDGRTLATAGDQTVRLWDLTRREHPAALGEPLTGHTGAVWSARFSPDGHTLATSSSDMTVRLWDVADPARPVPLGQPLTGHSDTVWSVAFSPDGRTLATSSFDRTVRLWDVADSARPVPLGQPLTGHSDTVWSVVFSPDGQALATGSNDTTARVWDLQVSHAISRICDTTSGTLTPQKWSLHIPVLAYSPPCQQRSGDGGDSLIG